MSETIKVWVTRYALSSGIFEAEVRPNRDNYVYTTETFSQQFRLGKDAFTTAGSAKRAAESARVKKIAALKKQIAKLEKMEF